MRPNRPIFVTTKMSTEQNDLLMIQPLNVNDAVGGSRSNSNDDNDNLLTVGVSSRLIYEGSPCDAFPCWNGGTCVELRQRKGKFGEKGRPKGAAAYTCKCGQFFTGQHCEQRMEKQQANAGQKCQPAEVVCPSGTVCLPQLLGECGDGDYAKTGLEKAANLPVEVNQNDSLELPSMECPMACQNGGFCIRLGTAPGHLECLCPSNFSGAFCQVPLAALSSAPLLPGLLLLSLILFLLAFLIICHGPASAGFFLQIGDKRGKRAGGHHHRRDSRKWPLLLEWANEREGSGEMGQPGENAEFGMESEGGGILEMRECRHQQSSSAPSSTIPSFCQTSSSSSAAAPFSTKKAAVQIPHSAKTGGSGEGGSGFGSSSVVHI